MPKLTVGQMVNGYHYLGGDPKSPSSWRQYAPEQPADPTTDMGTLERLGAGFGGELTSLGRKAVNLATEPVPSIRPDWASDEAIAEQKRIDSPLQATPAGAAGGLAADVAVSLPVGGLVGAGAKGLAGATGAATPRLSGALSALAAAQGPGAKVSRALVEGGLTGALMADPNSRGEEALKGAAISGALSGGGQALKRAVTGIVHPNRSAAELMAEGFKLPLAVAADDRGVSGTARRLYRQFLPDIPLGGRIRHQVEDAFDEGRKRLMVESVPNYARDQIAGQIKNLDTQSAMTVVDDFWNDVAYADVKATPFLVDDDNVLAAGDLSAEAMKELRKALKPSDEPVFGDTLLNAKTALWDTGNNAAGKAAKATDAAARAKILAAAKAKRDAAEHIDNMIVDQMSGGPRNAKRPTEDLKRYLQNADAYGKWKDLQAAVTAAAKNEGDTTFGSIAATSARRAGTEKGALGMGNLQTIASRYHSAMGDPLPASSTWRTLGIYGALIGSGALTGVAGPAAVLGSARALSNPTVQQALMGNTGPQKAMAQYLRNNAGQVGRYSRAARRAVTAGALEDE